MGDVAVLAVKAMNGGLFVVAFALLGEVLEPKRFAGLFSAAPSVALANLSVVLLTKGAADGKENAIGMIAGAIALIVFCVVARKLVARYDALIGSALACGVWLVVAVGLYAAVLR
jgi:uncharacterized membrane protein (GlpM family)